MLEPTDPGAAEPDRTEPTDAEITRRIAELLAATGRSVAVAESLTGGNVSARLSAVEGASDWFRGAVVAYDAEVKFTLLEVERGPVITEAAARQMAVGVARLLEADVAVATTGVGGPGPQEGRPQGTVFVAAHTVAGCSVREYHFAGDPADVVRQATRQALADVAEAVGASAAGPESVPPQRESQGS